MSLFPRWVTESIAEDLHRRADSIERWAGTRNPELDDLLADLDAMIDETPTR